MDVLLMSNCYWSEGAAMGIILVFFMLNLIHVKSTFFY